MSLARRLSPLFSELLASPRTRAVRQGLHDLSRRLRGARVELHYFHQTDDPYSHLAAQVLPRLLARFDLAFVPHVVGGPPDDAAPERARLEAFARKDAADVAPHYGLVFPPDAGAPDPARVDLARRILVSALPAGRFVAAATAVGEALWNRDEAALSRLAATYPPAAPAATQEELARAEALRTRLGHYLGATFWCAGEWYWGVDRLDHLERALEERVAPAPAAAPLPPRPDAAATSSRARAAGGPDAQRPFPRSPSDAPCELEFFLSLRSPYTYIVMERVYALADRTPARLALRPVLPMVMRGLPVPWRKRVYILRDTRREAERVGVPFGRVCDPVGEPVERAFSLLGFARRAGREREFLLSFARAAFAEGVDTGTDTGMRHVLERAGLDPDAARGQVDPTGWREELEANRLALLGTGLWGVPSFRVRGGGEPDFCTWGQDRLWLVEAEIRRRCG